MPAKKKTPTKKKPVAKKKKPVAKKLPPKYNFFDEIIYTDSNPADSEDPIELERGVVTAIEYDSGTYLYTVDTKKSKAVGVRYGPYGDCTATVWSGGCIDGIEEKEILGTTKDSAQAVNKIYDLRIEEIEKQRTKALKLFKEKK